MNINIYSSKYLFKWHLIPAYNTQYKLLMKIPSTRHVFMSKSLFKFSKQTRIPSRGYRNKTRASTDRSLSHIIRKSTTGWDEILIRKCDLAQFADLRTRVERTRARGLASLANGMRYKGGKKQGALGASRGNISGNKGMGTSVSMVIPSSGFGCRAGKRPSRAPRFLPTRRAASRRISSGRAEGQETPRAPSSPIAERIRE